MKIKINDNLFNVKFLTTNEEIINGAKDMENIDGCLLFNLKKGYHSFWMKDCLIPLDIIFVQNNKISKIFKNCEPCEICKESYVGYADYVLEFDSRKNYDLNINDEIIFIN